MSDEKKQAAETWRVVSTDTARIQSGMHISRPDAGAQYY
jgi:hypothetical protein